MLCGVCVWLVYVRACARTARLQCSICTSLHATAMTQVHPYRLLMQLLCAQQCTEQTYGCTVVVRTLHTSSSTWLSVASSTSVCSTACSQSSMVIRHQE